MARQIVIEFLGKDKSLSSTARGAEGSTSRLGDTLKKVGKVAAVGLAAGAVVAGKALFDMTKNALEDEAAAAKLEGTLKRAAGATDAQVSSAEKWIAAQGKALGVTDDELRPALARLATATGDVGEAQKLAALAMDVSAGSGKSLDSVSTALMKAQNGQVSALARLGIETTNAKGETLSFEQATKKMADTFGGAAQTQANTLQGKMARLKLILGETGEEIGAKLIPVVTKMADWFLNVGLPAITKFGGWVRDNLVPIFVRVREMISRVMAGLSGDVGGKLGQVRAVISDFVSIVRSLWKRFGGIITDYARNAFANLKQILGGAFKVIAGIFKVFSSLLKGDWKGVWDGIKKIVSGALQIIGGIVKQALNLIKTIFRLGWSALKGVVSGAWDGIKSLVRSGVDALVGLVKGIGGRISDVASGLFDGLVSSFKGAINAIIRGWNNLSFSIPGIDPPGPGKIPGVTLSTPNIPYLAEGGIVKARRGGTLAVLGEAGADEAVIPLSGRHAPRLAGGGDTYVLNIQTLDPNAAGKVVVKALQAWQNQTKRPIPVRALP